MAKRSIPFGLGLINSLTKKRTSGAQTMSSPGDMPFPERPKGELIWLHAENISAVAGVFELIRRLALEDSDLYFVLTTGEAAQTLSEDLPNTILLPSFENTRAAAAQFMAHWSPNLCIWSGLFDLFSYGEIAAKSSIPVILTDSIAPKVNEFWQQIVPSTQKHALTAVHHIFPSSAKDANRFKNLGYDNALHADRDLLNRGTFALPSQEAELTHVHTMLDGRPLWYASALPRSELADIAATHQKLKRRAHRLLLIISPEDLDQGADLYADLKALGHTACLRSQADVIPEDCSILISDWPDEIGLWYRLAPLSVMGGTFKGDGSRNPFEAAALGSAIMHGPKFGNYAQHYKTLDDARAAYPVTSLKNLASDAAQLLSPEEAATYATNGWDISSRGSETTDRVVEIAFETLFG
ncbi:MAG: 3-deoxy-D-manno-octulosonic acid transferase [Halocynthiibacter sp.]